MLRKPLLSLLLALFLGGLFFLGLTRLFLLRYEVGDVYPPYSSLRADPLGTKAIAEALDDLPNVEMRRNFKELPKMRPSGPVTLVYAGVSEYVYWGEDELLAFDQLIVNGSRAVFTFVPFEDGLAPSDEKSADAEQRTKKKKKVEEENPEANKKKSDDKAKATPAKSEKEKSGDKKTGDKKPDEQVPDPEQNLTAFRDVAKRWGFTFASLPRDKKAYDRHAALVEPGGKLETDIPWHTALYFKDLKPQWKVLYMCGMMPVVIERKYGSGSIILVADSFLVSNEGLRKERHPRLLSRIFGGPPTVIFDEEHNGLREDPGIASLARKYRLHGVVVALVLLALLFVWKNAVRFIPAYEPQFAEGDVVAGKETSEGFVNLLRRSIRPAEIFDLCVLEWRKAFAQQPRALAKTAELIAGEQSRPPRQRDPVGAYRAISQALNRKA